jgi:hypothetical protein
MDLLLFPICKLCVAQGLDNTVRDGPSQKIELGTRGRETLEIDTFGSTKRIEKLFTVPVQARLVRHVYREHLSAWRRQRHVVVFRVVCHEPLKSSERRAFATSDNIVKLFTILWNLEKLR